jgi:hypothetical protein
MPRKSHTEEQIVAVLRQVEAGARVDDSLSQGRDSAKRRTISGNESISGGLVAHSLNVVVHRDSESRVTQKFLNDFGIFPVDIQDLLKCVLKVMPADPLLEPCPS